MSNKVVIYEKDGFRKFQCGCEIGVNFIVCTKHIRVKRKQINLTRQKKESILEKLVFIEGILKSFKPSKDLDLSLNYILSIKYDLVNSICILDQSSNRFMQYIQTNSSLKLTELYQKSNELSEFIKKYDNNSILPNKYRLELSDILDEIKKLESII